MHHQHEHTCMHNQLVSTRYGSFIKSGVNCKEGFFLREGRRGEERRGEERRGEERRGEERRGEERRGEERRHFCM